MELKTDRLGLLLDQLDASVEIARQRLAGLTDDEYFWEPVPGCWSLRRRADAAPQATGAGDWVLDWIRPEPVPAPVTTIAWRSVNSGAGLALPVRGRSAVIPRERQRPRQRSGISAGAAATVPNETAWRHRRPGFLAALGMTEAGAGEGVG